MRIFSVGTKDSLMRGQMGKLGQKKPYVNTKAFQASVALPFVMVCVVATLCLTAFTAHAQTKQTVFGNLEHEVLAGCTRSIFKISPKGEILWQYDNVSNVHDIWMLPNGNILYADGASVTELSPEKKIVFRYEPEHQQGGGAYGCQRLEDGNTFIALNSTNQLIEVDPKGNIVFSMDCQYMDKPGSHNNQRLARKLKNGNYLVCHKGAKKVVEYAPNGKIVWEVEGPNVAFAAIRFDNGNTLCSFIEAIIEFDPDGKEVWRFNNTDLPGVTITAMCGIQVLPKGNIAVGCYAAYDKTTGEGNGLFEITRDKKLVWRYRNPEGPRSLMGVQVLGAKQLSN
jgi:outer membrane protein assembly factor BamB